MAAVLLQLPRSIFMPLPSLFSWLRLPSWSFAARLFRPGGFPDNYPPKPLIRKALWEGFPSLSWGVLPINSQCRRLQQLNGSEKHAKVLQDFNKLVCDSKDAANIIIALFAGIGAALLAVPGIERAHWITRALFFSAILLAIGGVIIGAMLPQLFSLFFGEDIDFDSEFIKNENNMLTWQNHRNLLYRICHLFGYQALSIPLSAYFLIAGIFAFSITADFSTSAALPSSQPARPIFAIFALGPFLIYMTSFWSIMFRRSVEHRRARDEMMTEIRYSVV